MPPDATERPEEQGRPQAACVLVFNASDPSGAGGLAADVAAIASVGAHPLPVVTGAYVRDTSAIVDHYAMEDESIAEQARVVLGDIEAQVIKVGFVGNPQNMGVIADIASGYEQTPVVAYMPDLSWWEESDIDNYLDAFAELILPLTSVLVGNHSTLRRWLLPEWEGDANPTPRDIARAAEQHGVPYTFVTGQALPAGFLGNSLASPQTVLGSEQFERIEASFAGAGDTLSAALAALLASGEPLPEAASEALSYLDKCLQGGFHPGMGLAIPDRLFWAQNPEDLEVDQDEDQAPAGGVLSEFPVTDTKH
jgi:hydroxymethylpyrimidine/phosphomethylpyrimidine kinase